MTRAVYVSPKSPGQLEWERRVRQVLNALRATREAGRRTADPVERLAAVEAERGHVAELKRLGVRFGGGSR
jgi:hypothetical protein